MAMPKGQLEAKLKEEHELITSGILREENPLDLSKEFESFLEACRRGDLEECQKQISAGVNINGKDEYDYTPLIVASLCGHYEVVQLLLDSGALAERNTFQGERCLYNALNDRIRNLLLSYDYSKSSDPLQPWSSHITSLLTRDVPKTSDITLTAASFGATTASEEFRLHKFLLAARTPYFRRKLTESPAMDTWRLSNQVPAEAFRIVLHYLYLEDLTPHSAAMAASTSASGSVGDADEERRVEEELFRGIDRISKHLEVEQLWEAMLAVNDRRLARQRYQDEVERAQRQVAAFFREHVVGNKIVVETAQVAKVKWPRDNFIFADCLLCANEELEEGDDADENDGDYDDDDDGNDSDEVEHDVNLDDDRDTAANTTAATSKATGIPVGPAGEAGAGKAANGAAEPTAQRRKREQTQQEKEPAADTKRQKTKPRSVLYPAHKALLVRSDYFLTMFSSAFLEAQASDHLHIITVDCAPEVLEIVLSFLYTEEADIPLELALEVLYAADMMFLGKLKAKAASIISTLGSGGRTEFNDPARRETTMEEKTGAAANEEASGGGGGGGGSHSRSSASNDDYVDNAAIDNINIYDVVRAAWDLRVQRLEEFAARFLALRLERYIDEPAFAALVLESAQRLTTREETDTVELVDDIRHFLSERFRLRFEDTALSDVMDEEAAVAAAEAEKEAAAAAAAVGEPTAGQPTAVSTAEATDEAGGVSAAGTPEASSDVNKSANAGAAPAEGETTAGLGGGGVVRTLDGQLVEDEFDSDAANYQLLLAKINGLLERLGLDG